MKRIICSALLSLACITYTSYSVSEDIQSSTKGEYNKAGTAGAQFLKIPVGARANAMGGAYTAVANDLSALYWNPAGIASTKGLNVDFNYTDYFHKLQHSFAAFSMPLGESYRVAVALTSFSTDDIIRTTIDMPQGDGSKYRMSDISMGATFSGYLTEQFSFGFTGKFLSNSFANSSSNGFSCDIGTQYDVGLYGIKLGFSMHNLGTEMNYTGTDMKATYKYISAAYAAPIEYNMETTPYGLPLTFRAGIMSEVYKEEEHRVIVAMDFETIADTKEQFGFGAEYTWDDMVAARVGYRTGLDQMGLSAGIGFKYNMSGFGGEINYSINPTKDLGTVNRFGIAVKLGN